MKGITMARFFEEMTSIVEVSLEIPMLYDTEWEFTIEVTAIGEVYDHKKFGYYWLKKDTRDGVDKDHKVYHGWDWRWLNHQFPKEVRDYIYEELEDWASENPPEVEW
jgi:hypothetical protein